jgi:hypothetical protein
MTKDELDAIRARAELLRCCAEKTPCLYTECADDVKALLDALEQAEARCSDWRYEAEQQQERAEQAESERNVLAGFLLINSQVFPPDGCNSWRDYARQEVAKRKEKAE